MRVIQQHESRKVSGGIAITSFMLTAGKILGTCALTEAARIAVNSSVTMAKEYFYGPEIEVTPAPSGFSLNQMDFTLQASHLAVLAIGASIGYASYKYLNR